MGKLWWIWLFPLIGVGLLGGAVWQVIVANRFKATARPAIGEVVGYSEYDSTDSDGHTSHLYDPIVRFTAEPERVVEKQTGIGSSPRPYRVGQRLKLLYSPENPEDYKINSPFQIYFAAGVLGFIGAVFLGVGLIAGFALAGPRPELVDTPAAEQLQETAVP
jgi:hypothetical protein